MIEEMLAFYSRVESGIWVRDGKVVTSPMPLSEYLETVGREGWKLQPHARKNTRKHTFRFERMEKPVEYLLAWVRSDNGVDKAADRVEIREPTPLMDYMQELEKRGWGADPIAIYRSILIFSR